MKNLIRAGLAIGTMLVPFAAYAQCGTNRICQVADELLWTINNVVIPLIFAVAVVVFLWGIFRGYIFKRGEEEVKTAHQMLIWGIVGLVIMISLWGIINAVANTFGLNYYQNYQPPLPQIDQFGGGY